MIHKKNGKKSVVCHSHSFNKNKFHPISLISYIKKTKVSKKNILKKQKKQKNFFNLLMCYTHMPKANNENIWPAFRPLIRPQMNYESH